MPNIDEELEQKSPDPRFDPDDPKIEDGEDVRDDDDGRNEREESRRPMRDAGQDLDEEELAEEDILEQADIDDLGKGDRPGA